LKKKKRSSRKRFAKGKSAVQVEPVGDCDRGFAAPAHYFAGIPVLLVAGGMAIYYSAKKTNYEDKLETLESEIHKLEISMA
jgi:hypothetical protein